MLIDRIRDDLKEAMKSREARRVEVLRFLLSEVKNVGINEKRELDDQVVIGVLQKLLKQRRDGMDQFRAAGRPDLVAKEEEEIRLLSAYLPQQIGEEEMEARLREIIAELGASGKKDLGKVMKVAMERLRGAADGKRLQAAVARLLP